MSLAVTIPTRMVAQSFGETFNNTVNRAINQAIQQLPGVIGAVIILALGYVIGSRIGVIVADKGYQMGLDSRFENTVVDDLTGQRPDAVSWALGSIAKYYVFLFAAFVAADVAAFQQVLPWLETLVVYVPNLFAGAAIIVLGLVFTEYAVERTRESEAVQASEFGIWIPPLVRTTLYVIAFVIGLEMIGINLKIVYLITRAIASAIGLGLFAALAVGLGAAAALLAKDYIDRELAEEGSDEV